ncbi:MAG: acyltransferase [Gammaproteobacteria bacterium]|nr:MAG: acyltransferase [Gammaproteobacteria bacterium]
MTTAKTSFLSLDELKEIGFKRIGKNPRVSRYARFYSAEEISLGDDVRIDDFCILSGNIALGNYVHIAPACNVYGQGGVVLEDFSGISSKVSVYSANDYFLGEAMISTTLGEENMKQEVGPVMLRKHVIIGSGCVVLPFVEVEIGAVVGALSLVKGIIREWSVYAGTPAKFIKKRESENIIRLEKEFLETRT